MNIYTEQKQTHRFREQTVVAKGEQGWRREGMGVWDQHMQNMIYTMYINKVLPENTGNYIQLPVINHNEKEYEKECIYIYIIYMYMYN